MISDDVKIPQIRFTEYSEMEMTNYGFYSYDFITHPFAFPIIHNYRITITNYIGHLITQNFYRGIVEVKDIHDIDLFFSYAFDQKSALQ